MTIHNRINNNFKGICLVCIKASKITDNIISPSKFFEGQKEVKTSYIMASKRLKKQYHLIGVGRYLIKEN